MKKSIKKIFVAFLLLSSVVVMAQDKDVTGVVLSPDGQPAVEAYVEDLETGESTVTDANGRFTLSTSVGNELEVSVLGYDVEMVKVGESSSLSIQIQGNVVGEVVYTALGISREKKSLGYATQTVSGEELATVKTGNISSALSGRVAGIEAKSSGTMGGSTNVVIRGYNSISGNNQALWVVDGVPISNTTSNTSNQTTGRGGYDYGNAAADINPDDVENFEVLKGAAATALYGSRGANGVIIVTTKKGKKQKKGLGITINSSFTAGNVDKSTLPEYQSSYGAGYSNFYYGSTGGFFDYDINGDGVLDLTTPFSEDASYGQAFDSSLMIYQWNSLYAGLDTYQTATPWVAARNTPNSFYTTAGTYNNSISLTGGNSLTSYRMSYTNFSTTGILPNSKIKRNNIDFNASHKFSDRLTSRGKLTYVRTNGKGRYGTGYDSKNVMQSFRQWWQVNVDVLEQKAAYEQLGINATWNPSTPTNLRPAYFDNPYFMRHQSYQNDQRDRYIGSFALDYKVNSWLDATARFSMDTFSELQEERIAVSSVDVSEYSRYNNNAGEYNYDFILTANKDLTNRINFNGNLGYNFREQKWNSIYAQTNGGLIVPDLYTLSNTKDPINAPNEYDAKQLVRGIYARASLSFDDTYYIEATIRNDKSSTLPSKNNSFWYPSITGSWIFSKNIDTSWLSFGKFRANYAEVGRDTNPYRVYQTYASNTPFQGSGSATNINALNNPNLKPETQKGYELGTELKFSNNRLGLDVSYYNTRTVDQIVPVPVSNSTGFNSAILNAGTIENKGWEVALKGTPVQTQNFSWDVGVNWSTGTSTVLELAEGINNLEIASLQGGVSINAAVGESYGTIRGTDYIYLNGQKVIDSNGYYERTSDSNQIIGDFIPEWRGGITNTLNYKGLSLSFLVDMQKGGDVFSLDTWYGTATGIYTNTVFTNDLGNPVRNSLADGGGIILDGVQEDGTKNTVRARMDYFANALGYRRNANKGHVYDASYVKLREASLSYRLPKKIVSGTPFTNVTASVIGRNLWIIHKNVPYSDPEAGLSAGNVQGYQSGAYPSVREIGASIKLQF